MKNKLQAIQQETNNKLTLKVIESLLDREEDEIESYIEDLMNHGCVSGMVGELIYYNDTVKFYQEFKAEIKAMLKETLDETGLKSPKELFGDKWDEEDFFAEEDFNQNLLAWFGYEETVRQIAYQLEMDI
jgi:hypothetical protein